MVHGMESYPGVLGFHSVDHTLLNEHITQSMVQGMESYNSRIGNRVMDYVRLKPGRGFKPIRAALYYAQRIVVHEGLRSAVAASIAASIDLRHPRNRANAPSADRTAVLASLHAAGIALLPSLKPQLVTEINE